MWVFNSRTENNGVQEIPPSRLIEDQASHRPLTAKTRLELGAMSVLAAMTCGAPAVYGQMAAGDSGARSVILTFSYTGELVHNAVGGARRGTTFAGVAGGEFTLLLSRLVGWHGARIFVFVLGTHGGAPSDLVGDVHGVSKLEAPPPARGRSGRRGRSRTCSAIARRGSVGASPAIRSCTRGRRGRR